jgi:ankyrin repeat protein
MNEEYWSLLDNKSSNPVHILCNYSKVTTIKKLIDKNNDLLNYRDERGQTPFQIVANKSNFQRKVCLMLLDYDSLAINNLNKYGETALHNAHYHIMSEIICYPTIDILCGYNGSSLSFSFYRLLYNIKQDDRMDFDGRDKSLYMIVKLFLKRHKETIIAFFDPSTHENVLHFIVDVLRSDSILRAVLPFVSYIINNTNKIGETALHYACKLQYSDKNQTVDVLLSHCKINIQAKTKIHGFTVLHIACQFHRYEIVDKLLQLKSGLESTYDWLGRSALFQIFNNYHNIEYMAFDSWLWEAYKTLDKWISFDVTILNHRNKHNCCEIDKFYKMVRWYNLKEQQGKFISNQYQTRYFIAYITDAIINAEVETRNIMFKFILEQT